MKHLFISFLVAMALTASAQGPWNPREPVMVATRLYTDCMDATLLSVREIEPSTPAIYELTELMDDKCLEWTIVWLHALVEVDFMDRPDYATRFNDKRQLYVSVLRRKLISLSKPR